MKAFFKLVILVLLTTLVFVLGFFYSLLRPRNPNNVYWTSQWLKVLAPQVLGVKISGENLDRLEQYSPCVYVSNHQNNFDIYVGSWTCPQRTVTIGKKSLIWIPLFGVFYWLSGNIFIDRKHKKKAYDSLESTAQKICRDNIRIWMMPEGTRSRGRGLLPFKKGAFFLAIKAQIPIVPVCFSSYHKRFDFGLKSPGEIRVSVLKPILTQGKKLEEAQALSDELHSVMKNEISRLDQAIDAKANSRVL